MVQARLARTNKISIYHFLQSNQNNTGDPQISNTALQKCCNCSCGSHGNSSEVQWMDVNKLHEFWDCFNNCSVIYSAVCSSLLLPIIQGNWQNQTCSRRRRRYEPVLNNNMRKWNLTNCFLFSWKHKWDKNVSKTPISHCSYYTKRQCIINKVLKYTTFSGFLQNLLSTWIEQILIQITGQVQTCIHLLHPVTLGRCQRKKLSQINFSLKTIKPYESSTMVRRERWWYVNKM